MVAAPTRPTVTITIFVEMLQFIRSKAGSFAVKILFVFLIGSFGIWGIGDFLRARGPDATVIKVGSHNITGDELQHEVRDQIERLRPQFGGTLDFAQAKALGIVDQTVDTLVNRALVDQLAADQHLVAGDRQIVDAIHEEKAFQNKNGVFDRATFENILMQNRLTEGAYEALLRVDLPRRIAVEPAIAGGAAPQILTDTIYKIRHEQRVADWLYLPAASVKDVPAPDDAAIQAYYDKHHDAFTAPEYRGFTLMSLLPADVDDQVKVTDDQIADSYKARVGEFTKEEKRHVLQILVKDDKTADAVEQALAAGKDFAEVAKTIAKQDPSTVDLGTVTKKELPPGTDEAAFAAKENEPTKPIKNPFGQVILKVTAIEPGGVKTLDEVKNQLTADLRKEAEGDLLYKLSTKVEDALASGADIDQIAQQFNLKTVKTASADEEGVGPDDKKIAALPVDNATVLKTVFETPQGQVSSLEELKDGAGFYAVKVDSVTAPKLKPLDQVKDQVKQAWTDEQRATKIAAQAKALADQVKPDMPLAKLAAAQKLQITTTSPITRESNPREVPLPQALQQKLFELKQGETATAAAPAGQFVAQLMTITPADPAKDAAATDQLSTDLREGVSEELLIEFTKALRQRYPVEVNRPAIDQLFAQSQ